MGCLYQLTSPAGKRYLGITTKTAEQRFASHIAAMFCGRRGALYSALRKYKPGNFKIETLVIANDWDYLANLETRAIAAFETKAPFGYNLTNGGEGVIGYELDEIDRKAISNAQRKRYEDPAQRQKLIEQSKKANKAMKEAHASRRIDGLTPYHYAARLKRATNTPEQKSRKISEAVKAAWANEEYRARMSAAASLRMTESVRAAISAANLGKKHAPASEERKVKIGVAQKAAWADPEIRRKRLEERKARLPRVHLLCAHCSAHFDVAPWEAKRNPTFCSKKCKLESKLK